MSLKPPPSRVLEAFKHVFHNTNDAGETFPTLGGRSARILDDEDDLMALRSPPEEDRMTRFLRNYFPLLFVVSSHLPGGESLVESQISTSFDANMASTRPEQQTAL